MKDQEIEKVQVNLNDYEAIRKSRWIESRVLDVGTGESDMECALEGPATPIVGKGKGKGMHIGILFARAESTPARAPEKQLLPILVAG